MPHIIVKLVSGKSEDQKIRIAELITKDVMTVLGYGEDAVSVAFEDIASQDWMEKVYKPYISGKPSQLYKKPGYGPLSAKASLHRESNG